MRQAGNGWRTDHFGTEYRALLRAELAAAAHDAGLADVRWHEPEATGYYQPIATARRC